MDHIKPTGTTMKKIIVMLVLAASALVGMATTAGALSSAVQTQIIGRGGVGGSGREWACAGNDQWKEAVCLEDPVPASAISLQP